MLPPEATPMTITITELLARAEARHQAAERASRDARAALKRFIDLQDAAGVDQITDPAALQRVDALALANRQARDELTAASGALAEIRAAAADEAVMTARQAEQHPTGYASPGGRGGLAGTGLRTSEAGAGGARWVRSSDGRPAVVARGQRFADHEIVAEQIARGAERDRHIIGMHGGLGSLIRSMSTTSGSAVVPQVWAADVIDRARNLAAVVQAGAEVVPMDAKTVLIGRLTADPAAGFRSEGSAITATDPTFDNVTLTATTLTALVVGSLEWFQDVTPGGGADELVTEALAKVIALQIDLAALYGQVVAGAEQTAVGNNLLPSGGLPSPNPRGILANLLANAASSVLGGATNGT